MPTFILFLFRFARLLFSGHAAVVENGALRLQLAAFRRKRKRPVLTSFDRLFWVGLSPLWTGMARCSGLCPSRHGRSLAARAVSPVWARRSRANQRRRAIYSGPQPIWRRSESIFNITITAVERMRAGRAPAGTACGRNCITNWPRFRTGGDGTAEACTKLP